MVPECEKKCIKRISLLIFVISVTFSLIIGFFVAFYLRNLSRFAVTLTAGVFMGLTLGFSTYSIGYYIFSNTKIKNKRAIIHLLVFPISTVIFGVMAELLIFQEGGTHYYWVIGATLAAIMVGAALETYEKLKELIINSLSALEKIYHQVVLSLNKSLEIIEPYNRGHCERVAWYAMQTAKKLGLDEEDRLRIVRAALLHDLGKIGISEKILLKESDLDEEEWQIMRSHPDLAAKILNPLRRNFSKEISIIHYHHERSDGNGYRKIPDDEIPLESMIIGVSEAFDTMTIKKPYGPPLSFEEALDELRKARGSQFRDEIVDAFIDVVKDMEKSTHPSLDEIRKELKFEDMEEEISFEIDPVEQLSGVTKKMTFLTGFYQLMGQKKKKLLSHLYIGIGAGVMLGIMIGLSVYSISKSPVEILSFFLQGLFAGATIFLVGPALDQLLTPKDEYSDSFWQKIHGKALMFFPAGLMGGYIALKLVYFRFYPEVPQDVNVWNILYVLVIGIISSGTSYLSYLSRKTASILLNNLKNLQKLYFELIYSLSFALEAKDPYTRGHTERVAGYCELVSSEFDLDKKQKEDLKLAAFFHDIGKIGVKLSVLNKNSTLNEKEYDIMKQHPQTGAEMIEAIGHFIRLAPYIRHHHEHWDGKGYPNGLKGEKIPLISRIIAVADAYDALTTDRPYKKGFSKEKAISILKEEAGTKYDSNVVEKFIRSIEKTDPETFAKIKVYPEIR